MSWKQRFAQIGRQALGRLSPSRNGYLKIKGLEQGVEVLTDAHGVPHIYAGSLHDVLFAQGFIHARERIFQMELNRRVGQGRLSEIFGPSTLAADRFVRRIGLRQLASQHWESMTGPGRQLLEAYAAGVNRGMQGLRPPELLLLGLTPEPWRPQDTLLWSKVMAFDMGSNWESELVRAELAQKLGSELALRFHQAYLPECPITALEDVAVEGHTLEELRALYDEAVPWLSLGFGRFPGSNAWAVSGRRSQSGKPMLANDPHLVLRLPSTWFEMHLDCPEMSVYGATMPGAAGVVIGHNGQVAWGVTNSYVDTQDLVIEELIGDTCRRPEGLPPAPLRHRTEHIAIKGHPPHHERITSSDNGPFLCQGDTHGLALRWTGYNFRQDTTTDAIFMLNRARSAQEVRQALSHWGSPCLNFVYADTEGNIGYQLAGAVPRRRQGVGLVPIPGWDSRFEWDGLLPLEELPRLENPECGYVVSANHAITGRDFPHFLSLDWMGGFRAQRLEQLLAAEGLTVSDFARFQMDTLCLPGLALRDLLGAHAPQAQWPPSVSSAFAAFLEWDGQLAADSVGGCIYQYLLLHLCRQAFHTVLGEGLFDVWMGSAHSPVALMGPYGGRYTGFLLHSLRQGDVTFLAPGDSWEAVVARAVPAALEELRQHLGEDPAGWRWGAAHRLQLQHPLASIPQLAPLFNGLEVEFGGDTDTVCQSAVLPHRPYRTESWAPSYRFVADMAAPDQAQSVLPSGQSGWPGDPHYLDQWPLWLQGHLHPCLFHRGELERSRPQRLSLLPKA